MEVKELYAFQADSEIVNQCYQNDDNYLIEYDNTVPEDFCIVYFSSNDIYYPNNEIVFTESIIRKNRYEWYKNRINYGYKHVFIRDIKKQWYLSGINTKLNTPGRLIDFINSEAKGYKLILVGSSAGGFFATIAGQLLNAERIYTFNGQFEILSLLNKKNVEILNPILYRNKSNSELLPYYDSINFIKNPATIFYFHSAYNDWDMTQSKHVEIFPINKISFRTSNHGIPFLRSNISSVLNLSLNGILGLSGKIFHPLAFSISMVGLVKTVEGLFPIIQFALNKMYIHTIQKCKGI